MAQAKQPATLFSRLSRWWPFRATHQTPLINRSHTGLIEFRQVVKTYETPAGPFTALKGVDLQVNQGEFVAVIGKSGSGKSTLINMVTGIDRPSLGELYVAGIPIHTLDEQAMIRWRRQYVGVVFQFFQLLPTLSLIENIMLPMEFSNRLQPTQRLERARQLLDMVGLADQGHKYPSMVSGGQQQRAAIARSLANDPDILIADEPTGSLDSKTADTIFRLFENLIAQNKTILMVTHDQDLAARVSRVVMIADGEIIDKPLRYALPQLDNKLLVDLSAQLTSVTYPPNTIIFEQNSPSDNFYIVLNGRVDIIKTHPTGETITLATLHSGQYFGEMGLIDGTPRSATARTSAHGQTILMSLDRKSFLNLLDESELTQDNIAHLTRQRATATHLLNMLDNPTDQTAIMPHERLTYPPGAIIFQVGDIADKFYLILDGNVEVVDEESAKVIARLSSGQYFGELGILEAGQRTKTVRAALDNETPIDLMAVEAEAFRQFSAKNREFAHDITITMNLYLAQNLQTSAETI